MAVAQVNVLPYENLPHQRNYAEYSWARYVAIDEWTQRQMVNLKSVGHVPNSFSLIPEHATHQANLMATFDQALRELIRMSFNTS